MNGFATSELIVYGAGAFLLLIFNAFFVATEFSLVKLRFTRFGTGKMKEAKQNPSIARLLENMGPSVKLMRLGGSLCSIGLALLLLPLCLTLVRELGWFPGAPLRFSILLTLIAAVSAHFVLGELVPRALALQFPVQSLKIALPLVTVFRFVATPVSILLSGVSAVVLRAFRVDPKADLNLMDVQAQIRSMLTSGEELPPLAESIVNNALELRKRVAHDIMIPRNQLQYIDLEDPIEENLALIRKMGHTRFPLCEGGLDRCVGIIHIKDVFRSGKPAQYINWQKLKRPMIRFSVDESLDGVLQRFLKSKKHFGLLIDEFGGTVGAITLEDVLEELVGEIQDEFDRDEVRISDLGEGLYEVDGLTPLHDLAEELDVELEAEEVSTFGGYITYELGRMPRVKETFRIGPLEITATVIDRRRVVRATVRVVTDEARTEEQAGAQRPEA